MQSTVNRLALAVLAAAMLVSSALIAVFADATRIAGLAWVAVPGALIGFAIAAWLAVGIFRSGRW